MDTLIFSPPDYGESLTRPVNEYAMYHLPGTVPPSPLGDIPNVCPARDRQTWKRQNSTCTKARTNRSHRFRIQWRPERLALAYHRGIERARQRAARQERIRRGRDRGTTGRIVQESQGCTVAGEVRGRRQAQCFRSRVEGHKRSEEYGGTSISRSWDLP
jgi:hypothetical protein